ncbi:methyl-accepting chemotaxis protein [Desulfocurvibacter africanus]|uniref:methyl-accepting chemotaxis protein n=1 Tax=Desulfocurvibacter africanus TaxID=873 RepID=UPI000406D628|nr:methyl-accepting chemotaxis protein [Desulfocurvibacter africanus]
MLMSLAAILATAFVVFSGLFVLMLAVVGDSFGMSAVSGLMAAAVALLVVWVLLRRALDASSSLLLSHVRDPGKASIPHGAVLEELFGLSATLESVAKTHRERVAALSKAKDEAESRAAGLEAAVAKSSNVCTEAEKRTASLEGTALKAFEIAENLSYSAATLNSQADQVAEAMVVQKDRVAETATAMEEMNATVLEVARSAERAASSAERSREKAGQGSGIVGRAVQAIDRVEVMNKELETAMSRLGEQAGGIGEIMNMITEIADQTNLLALNAAIEAARAGDAGRGFAVVADEVRKLAEKTMNATRDVEESIKTIQQSVAHNLTSMSAASAAVTEAADLARRSGEMLGEIVALVGDNSDQVRSIATAAEEQSAASEEINRAISEINRLSDDTTSEVQGTVRTIQDIRKQSERLHQIFKEVRGAQKNSLAASEGQMKGVLPKLMVDYIGKTYGDGVRRKLLEELGNPVFMIQNSYPDAVMGQMAGIVSRLTGDTKRKILFDLGSYTPGEFAKLYKKHIHGSELGKTDLKKFLLRMNEVHEEITKGMPGITPPRFSYEDKGDTLVMTYHSKRGFFDYFEGILHGATKMFGRKAEIKVKSKDAATAVATIRFQ